MPVNRTHLCQRGAPGVGAGRRGRWCGRPRRGGGVRLALVTSRPETRAPPGMPEATRQPVDSSSALSGDPGTEGAPPGLAVTGSAGDDGGHGTGLGAARRANAGGRPVRAVDRGELARWAGLQGCSFAPRRLFEHDARDQRRQGLEQRRHRPGPRAQLQLLPTSVALHAMRACSGTDPRRAAPGGVRHPSRPRAGQGRFGIHHRRLPPRTRSGTGVQVWGVVTARAAAWPRSSRWRMISRNDSGKLVSQ